MKRTAFWFLLPLLLGLACNLPGLGTGAGTETAAPAAPLPTQPLPTPTAAPATATAAPAPAQAPTDLPVQAPAQSPPASGDAALAAGTAPAPASPAPRLDPDNLDSVLRFTAWVVREKQPGEAARMVGPNGARFAPYAVGAEYLGRNNGEEIAQALAQALSRSDPVCVGFDPLFGTGPDKAILVYRGLVFDWQAQGLGEGSELAGFEFFKLDGAWQLVYIVSIPPELAPAQLEACP